MTARHLTGGGIEEEDGEEVEMDSLRRAWGVQEQRIQENLKAFEERTRKKEEELQGMQDRAMEQVEKVEEMLRMMEG